MFKRSVVALGAALAVAGGVQAAPVTFDTNTSVGVIQFNNMVWQAGNALILDAVTNPVGAGESQSLHTVAQARLGSFTLAGSGGSVALPFPAEITYQADFWENATGIGGGTAAFTLDTTKPATIKFFFDNNPATFGDNTTGANYGDGTLILAGNLLSLTGNYTDFTILSPLGFPNKPLDCDAALSGCVGFDGIDQAPGTLTHQGNGNNQIGVDVTFQNNAFFLTNVSSLLLDMSQSVGAGVPFNNGNPWREIVGQTPYFSLVDGVRVNGGDNTAGDCTGSQSQAGVSSVVALGTLRCDQLLQTTGLTTFNTALVPEPSMIALLGISFVGFGIAGLSRKKIG